MQSLGYSIALDVDKQDEPRAWSAMSIAVAWFEASGRNMREFDHMFFADQIWARCNRVKKRQITDKIIDWSTNEDIYDMDWIRSRLCSIDMCRSYWKVCS